MFADRNTWSALLTAQPYSRLGSKYQSLLTYQPQLTWPQDQRGPNIPEWKLFARRISQLGLWKMAHFSKIAFVVSDRVIVLDSWRGHVIVVIEPTPKLYTLITNHFSIFIFGHLTFRSRLSSSVISWLFVVQDPWTERCGKSVAISSILSTNRIVFIRHTSDVSISSVYMTHA